MRDFLQTVLIVGSLVCLVVAAVGALIGMGRTLGTMEMKNSIFAICKTGEAFTQEVDYAKLVLTCEVVK